MSKRNPSHFFLLSCATSLLAFAAVGCSSQVVVEEEDGFVDDTTSPITKIDHTSIKRQSIGNCWIYSNLGMVEALHKRGTGEVLNLSESYMTYFHWFDQIANVETDYYSDKEVELKELETGGNYDVAGALVRRYGMMTEKDFVPAEAEKEMSDLQKVALDTINASLKSGVLSTISARKDRALVRRELDKAWKLSSSVVGTLDKVFGKDVSRSLSDRYKKASSAGTPIKDANSFMVTVNDPVSKKPISVRLTDVLPTRNGQSNLKYGYNVVSYPTAGFDAVSTATKRREVLRRVQRALHDGVPVQMSWFVDFNSMESEGQFRAPPAKPGKQGGHMVNVDDYEVTNVPGFGTLKAGVLEKRPEALKAALDEKAEISFLRIKNSWGNVRPDRNFTTGYHDLHLKYLNGPVAMCEQKDGVTDPTDCRDGVPFDDVLLPAGY